MANDNIGLQPLPHHDIERFGNTVTDSHMVIWGRQMPSHVRIDARPRFRPMSNDSDGRDFLVNRLGDEADLVARLRELRGKRGELPETPSMNEGYVHRA
jgi:hypothetical protein